MNDSNNLRRNVFMARAECVKHASPELYFAAFFFLIRRHEKPLTQ